MAAASFVSRILVARQDTLAFIQIIGRGSFQNAHLVKSFYQDLVQQGVNRFVVDLVECTYLDSTFLGTLAGLGLKMREMTSGRLHIVNASTRNMELLQNLGLDRLFAIDAAVIKHQPPGYEELPQKKTAGPEASLNMLEAHQTLMNIDPRNIPKFKDVVTFLKEDLGRNNVE